MNRTLMNMERSMMFLKNVKLMFWGDAVICVSYLRNISPYHALKDNTPHEIWFGHLPSVRRLRVFGSTYYSLIPKEQRKNLVLEVEDEFSWGIQTLPRHTIFMIT